MASITGIRGRDAYPGPVTLLGLPPLPARTEAPPLRSAWDSALYGADGFFRLQAPSDHFRTSVTGPGAPLVAGALLGLLREHDLDTVVDVGAGRGELLRALHALDPALHLLGVEVAGRPADLPAAIGWTARLPESVDGLLLAHEWLDNVPCHVVEVDGRGVPRVVHVDPATGLESLGRRLDEPGVPESLGAWLARWWPVEGAPPGTRAEVGTSRDAAWADAVRRVGRGLAVTVDYGHTVIDRPPLGSLRSYAAGRELSVAYDGSRDVTAHVAVDAVAARVGGRVLRQRELLARLGVSAERPPLSLATTDPVVYAHDLARSTVAADLLAPGGLGDFYWVVSEIGLDPA